MRTVINVRCKDQTLSYIKMPLVTSGNINEDKIKFEFDQVWDGFTKTAIFYRNEADVYHMLLDENNSCFIPPEVLTSPGYVYFGVFGTKDDRVRTSEIIQYTVKRGAITEATKISDPTPDIYTQIMMAFGNKVNKTDLSVVATSGDYNDLINKPDIPSIEGLATEEYVDNAIKNIDIPEVDLEIPDGSITPEKLDRTYATEDYVDDKVANIDTSGSAVQSDWNQNDPTQPDYIKNRLAYYDRKFEDMEQVEYPEPITGYALYEDEESNETIKEDMLVKFADLPENATVTEFIKEIKGVCLKYREKENEEEIEETIRFDDPDYADLKEAITYEDITDEEGNIIGSVLLIEYIPYGVAVNSDNVVWEWHLKALDDEEGLVTLGIFPMYFP